MQALDLMMRFAERTGVGGDAPQRRYLWTDAFAVCNFLALGREDLALRLVELVHRTLGQGTAEHPTQRGLRIGKPMPERGPSEPFDEALEWERDGQYFHYLTKWMHALDVLARASGRDDLARWSRELAIAAHRGFTYERGGIKRMYWKVSIDLTRPLVASMGHHDPLDGFITAVQLGDLPPELFADYAGMLDVDHLATSDTLGIGGLLLDACRVHQLIVQDTWLRDVELLDPLLDAALLGLRSVHLDGPAHRRLGFRELGLSIGLAGIELVNASTQPLPRSTTVKLAELAKLAPLRTAIEAYWLDPAHRQAPTWTEHQDINDVMLATSLVPSVFLTLAPRRMP